MSATARAGRAVPRRAALLAGAGIAGLLVTGGLASCSDDAPAPAAPPSPTPTADDLAVARARASASRLLAAAVALSASAGDSDAAPALTAAAADHRAHLAALGAPSPSPSPAASASPRGQARNDVRAAVRAQVGAETTAAQEALDDVPTVSPGVATLLARIAAARAAHADLLAAAAGVPAPGVLATRATDARQPAPPSPAPLPGVAPPGTPSPTPTPGSTPTGAEGDTTSLPDAARDALAGLTAGEHAAVYAYGAVVARVAQQDRNRARDAWAWHTARRDLLEERLLAAGVQPPAAAPAYDLGVALDPAGAAGLAATVEDRLAVLAARAVTATVGPDRSDAAEELVAVARRSASWRGRVAPLPG